MWSIVWYSSNTECRGEREEGEVGEGMERAQDSSPAPRSVSKPPSQLPHSLSFSVCCGTELSVKERLKLIKSKAVEVVSYLKVLIF